MKKFKNKNTGEVINSSEYDSLPNYQKNNYSEIDDSGDFLTSAVIGAVTDNALLGGIVGGSLLGGLAGDLFNDGSIF